MMHVIVFGAALFPLAGAIICVAANFDVFYYLSEMYLLPVIYERQMSISFACSLARLVVLYIWVTELGRFIAISGLALVAYVFLILSVAHKLRICNRKCHPFYAQFRLFFIIMRDLMNAMTGFLMGFWYLILISLAWIVVKCYGDMPILLYSFFFHWPGSRNPGHCGCSNCNR